MLKIATVFSGIGAIEHALQRMNINHKIVFACDNGDVNIFEKKIPLNVISVKKEIESLTEEVLNLDIEIGDKFQYLNDFEAHLDKIKKEFNLLINRLYCTDINISKCQIINYLIENKIKSKEISTLINLHNNLISEDDIHIFDKLVLIDLIIKYENKKKNNIKSIEKYLSIDKKILENKDFKDSKKALKEIVENISMIYEKIKTLNIYSNLNEMESFHDKKVYIDSLYKKSKKTNYVKKSYFANYNIEEKDFHHNISFIDGTQYRDKVDLFVGGSPCQSFSMVGKQRGLQDTRGTLFYEFARLVKEIQPKVFIYENVKAVTSNDEGKTWETMKCVFDEIGYNWNWEIINSKNFGIPQNRERIFVVGFRKDLILNKEFSFPKSIKLEKKMKDFLVENVSGKYYLNKKGVEFVTNEVNLKKKWTQIDGDIQLCQKKNQQFNWHGDFVFEEENKSKEETIEELEKYFLSEKVKKYVLSSGTKNFYSKPEIDLEIARPLLTTMHKMHRAGVDNYVTTNGRLRKLTPRECLRLMGFCDSFKLVVSDTQAYQQAGNSIVVNVLIAIMNQITKSLPQIKKGQNYLLKDEKNLLNEIAVSLK